MASTAGWRSRGGSADRECSIAGPRQLCTSAKTRCTAPRARQATFEYAAITQARGNGYGVVSRARIRSRPSSAGSTQSAATCSVRRRNSS
jgi:hypothetical protein